jgi:hypothetical protein
MLASSAAYVEGIRALLLQTAFYIDRSYTTEGDEQHRYRSLVELLTPVCKAWGSDWGFRVTEWCLQVYGGYGYTKDYPAEQYLRDAKIASIYEGTNGIQALDLVTRKLRLDNGQPFMDLLSRARKAASSVVSIGALEAPAGHLESAVDVIGGVLQSMPKHSDATLLTLMNAVPFLDMFGHVLAGCFLFEQAAIANQKLVAIAEKKGVPLDPGAEYRQLLDSDRDARFYHNKIQTAAYFGYRGLPNVAALGVALRAGEISCETMVL